MPPVHIWHSRDRESSALGHDLTELVAPSSRRATERSGLRTTAGVLEAAAAEARSRCLR